MTRFNSSQKAQLALARQEGVLTSECRNHTEWGPTLMNMCWNREKRGQSIQPVIHAGRWIQQNLPAHGTVIEDDLEIIVHIVDTLSKNREPVHPIFDIDHNLDLPMYKFKIKRQDLLDKGSCMLWSNRVSINDANMFDMPVIMGEGLGPVNHIIAALQSWAADTAEQNPRNAGLDPVANRQLAMTHILLTLDDMNIRGYQISYALEYAGGSIEMLYKLLNANPNDPADMCAYINMRSAKDYLAGAVTHNQIAVTSGASFQHAGMLSGFAGPHMKLNMDEDTAKAMASQDIKPQNADWSNLEIRSRVDMDQACRIMSARGFELICKVQRPDQFDKTPVYSMIWYHPENQDYVEAAYCQPHNVCYGGVSLYLHRAIDKIRQKPSFAWRCSSGPDETGTTLYFEFSSQNGLFRYYPETLPACQPGEIDWSQIGFSRYGIPIPVYFKMPFRQRTRVPSRLYKLDSMLRNMGEYYFEQLVNAILCFYNDALVCSPSPHYRLYKNWFLAHGIEKLTGWSYGDRDGLAQICSAVFAWLNMPADTIRTFTASLEDAGSYDFVNGTSIARDIQRLYDLPDPETLPIKLPWF